VQRLVLRLAYGSCSKWAARQGSMRFLPSGQIERNLIRERTYAGPAAAKVRGRRKKLGDKQRAVAVDLYRQKRHTIDDICMAVGISRPTLYKYVAAAGSR
jgi:DNA invertase Pin-like site-specific DNA recombinase